jgi:DNA-binding response OmpR family regulator
MPVGELSISSYEVHDDREERTAAPPENPKSALVVSPLADDHELLGQTFVERAWVLYGARTLGSAVAFLRCRSVPVVIAERDLPPRNWKDALAAIQRLPDPPLLVVASRLADEHLWAEVLNLGGYDVLAKPFQAGELRWVMESAWRIKARNNKRPPRTGAAPMSGNAR